MVEEIKGISTSCRELLGPEATPSNTEAPSDRQDAREGEVWRLQGKVCEVMVVETLVATPDGQPSPESRAQEFVNRLAGLKG